MYQSNIVETVVDATGAIVQERTIVSQGDESSVEISQNSKGEPRVTVKIYHADADSAAQQALDLYDHVLTELSRMKE